MALGEGRLLAAAQKHDGDVLALSFSSDGKTLASGGADDRVRIWSLADGSLTERTNWNAHAGGVLSLNFLPQQNRIVTSGGDGRVTIWSLDRRAVDTQWKFDSGRVVSAVSPDGGYVAAGLPNGDVGIIRISRRAAP